MFLIHKHSIVYRLLPKGNYEEILASEINEGDVIRGYDLFTNKFTKTKIISKVTVMARKISLKTTSLDYPVISEDTFIASTSGIWMYRSIPNNVKLFKKTEKGMLLTPKPMSFKFDSMDLFVSVATASPADTLLVDYYLQVTKDWNGLKIKSVGSASTQESLDAGQGTQSSTD